MVQPAQTKSSTPKQPAINAIVVNYNGQDSLIQCVESLLSSTVSLAIYVIDNCSLDNSFYQLSTHLSTTLSKNDGISIIDETLQQTHYHNHRHSISLIQNSANKGFAAANNLVLNHVAGDAFFLVNPDCMVNPNSIEKLTQLLSIDSSDETLNKRPIGMASCIIRNEDGTIQATSKRRFPTPASALARMLFLNKWIKRDGWSDFNYGALPYQESIEDVEALSGAFMAVTGQSLQKVGGLDEGYFMHCEDLDWCMRYHQAGYRVVSYSDAEVMHIKEVSSASRPIRVIWFMHRGMVRFFEKFYKNKYPVWQRYTVYLGIVTRLLIKVGFTLLKNIFQSLKIKRR